MNGTTVGFQRWKLHLSVVVLAIAAMTLALTPAVADPLSGTDEYPDVAFLARNDVPFDAQTAASMAAQLGAPMFITNPNALADAARDGIADLNPDVIIVAGGVFAVSDEVANEAAAACDPDCTIDRRFGAGRDQTAADLATIREDYGFDRPVLRGSNQIVGDVNIGGTANVDDLTIQDPEMVAGLNADRVDGKHGSDFAPAPTTITERASCTGGSFHPTSQAGTRNALSESYQIRAGQVYFSCAVHLPDGARVTMVDLVAYDGVADAQVWEFGLVRSRLVDPDLGLTTQVLSQGPSALGPKSATPGYVRFTISPSLAPDPVDTAAYAYFLFVGFDADTDPPDANLGVAAMTVTYELIDVATATP